MLSEKDPMKLSLVTNYTNMFSETKALKWATQLNASGIDTKKDAERLN